VRILTWRAMSVWPDPSALFEALEPEVVKQKAARGEGAAQFSMGCLLLREAEAEAEAWAAMGGTSRSRMADVGLALCSESLSYDCQPKRNALMWSP
jgi:hypothetical protein